MKRTAPRLSAAFFLLLILLTSCRLRAGETPPPPTAIPAAETSVPAPFSGSPLVISEVLAGISGDNYAQYIELYNRTHLAIDLDGYTLWYRLPSSAEDLPVYRWRLTTLVPPNGHFLLVRAEGVASIPGSPIPDGEFEQPINAADGGLVLRGPDGQTADALGWGEAPGGFYEGTPAPSITRGQTLQRKPGSGAGSGADTDDNSADFALNPTPNLQNAGSPAAPQRAEQISVQVIAPKTVMPGSEFEYVLRIANRTSAEIRDARLVLPLPDGLELMSHAGVELALESGPGNTLAGPLGSLAPGEETTITLGVKVPYSYTTLRLANYYILPEDQPELAGYGGPVLTRIEGGQVPVSAARGLVDAELTVEGQATMYTGGFFAGDGSTKFYLQDETGGIQVQVFGGQGQVSVKTGDRVRVRGKVGVYRDAVQIVPVTVPGDVQVTPASAEAALVQPRSASPGEVLAATQQNAEDTLAGRLVQVEGQMTRIEEFTYSYEIDLTGKNGEGLTLYLDKLANFSIDKLETGQDLRAAGIVEIRDGQAQLYPRGQADLQPVYPPTARIEMDAPVTVPPGERFTVRITATNNTPNLIPLPLITLPIPEGAWIIEIMDGGAIFEPNRQKGEVKRILWTINDLRPNGGSETVRVVLQAFNSSSQIELLRYRLEAPVLVRPVYGADRVVFTSGSMPVGSVQGTGDRSPFTGSLATINGIVTGVFPGLSGFWIQGQPDGNRQTSDAIFVETGAVEIPPVKPGDSLQVIGLVRESSEQTSLQVQEPPDVKVLQQGATIPAPLELDPPQAMEEALNYYEAIEGMLVSVPRAVAVSPTSSFGEYVVVRGDLAVSRLYQGQPEKNGIAIMVDDGVNTTHENSSELAYTVRTGDLVSGLSGPLAFSFGRYKIQPVQAPGVQSDPLDLPRIAPARAGELSLMTWNVENLFDHREPNPSDPPMPTLSEYQRSLRKTAATIAAAGAPDVVGLQEVENLQVLEEIAAQDELESYNYQPYLEEGSDSRGIDVGFLVRSDRVEVLSVRQYADAEGVFSREPLLIHLKAKETGQELYAVVNHFTSMSGGAEATEPRRILQAKGNLAIVDEVLEENPDALVAVLGDLNAYFNSAPIDTLRAGGLRHALDKVGAAERYTYIYQGESQVLDHILLTPPLFDRLDRVEILHINSDFPPAPPDDISPAAKSDHDPVVAVFNIE